MPTGQREQSETFWDPSELEKVPGSHLMQVKYDVAPVAVEYVPALQAEHSVAAYDEYLPAGHILQDEWFTEPKADEYVPAAQIEQELKAVHPEAEK